MYVIKNAMSNIRRHKGRYTLIVFLIFIIVLTTGISFIVKTTIAEIVKDYQTKFDSEVDLQINFEKWVEATNKGEVSEIIHPSLSQQLAFGESDLLHSASYKAEWFVSFEQLTPLWENEQQLDLMIEVESYFSSVLSVIEHEIHMSADGVIRGSRGDGANSIFLDFEKGVRNLIEGRFFEELNECIISEELATLNHLSIGDTITLSDLNVAESLIREFIIVGIYEDVTTDNISPTLPKYSVSHPGNEILVSFETLLELEQLIELSSIFYLQDPEFLDCFYEEIKELGLPAYWTVGANESSYYVIITLLENLSQIFNLIMILVLVLGSTILTFIFFSFTRERKYEIRILHSIGMKKIKIARGLVYESLVVTGMGLILGVIVALAVVQPVTNQMLARQLKVAQLNDQLDEMFIIYFNDDSEVQMDPALSELEVELNSKAKRQILVVALFLSAITGTSSLLFVIKYEPMKSLSERN